MVVYMCPVSISLWYHLSSIMFVQDFILLRILCLSLYCLIAIILPSVLCGVWDLISHIKRRP